MKSKATFLSLLITFILVFLAISPAFAEDFQISTSLDTGYRIDNLRWNIAGNYSGNSPNILSELTWKDLKIYQIGAHTKIYVDEGIFVQGSFNYGIIVDGKNQDSDYDGDNRTFEYSRSNNSSDGDNVGDFSMAIGINTLTEGAIQISPLFGYAYSWQNVRMTNGYQTINTRNNKTGPFSGLNSTYKASWQGPWLGVSLRSEFSPEWSILGNLEYHLLTYSGEGNWNMRDDLDHPVSFEHSANGEGYNYSLGLAFSPDDQIHFILKYCYTSWSTDHGTDTTYWSNGAIGVTRFNEAIWDSEAVEFSCAVSF
jgi:hypothetical protein